MAFLSENSVFKNGEKSESATLLTTLFATLLITCSQGKVSISDTFNKRLRYSSQMLWETCLFSTLRLHYSSQMLCKTCLFSAEIGNRSRKTTLTLIHAQKEWLLWTKTHFLRMEKLTIQFTFWDWIEYSVLNQKFRILPGSAGQDVAQEVEGN